MQQAQAAARSAHDLILATDGLTMEFKGFRAVDGVADLTGILDRAD